MAYWASLPYTHGSIARTGVLLVNLGTPDEPTKGALRRYLKQFLSDPRVVEIPRALWWLILNGIILNVRPAKSAAKYAQIWMQEGSPLKVYTERQSKLLQGYLGQKTGADILVRYAMSYGNPSIDATLKEMAAAGCDRVLVLPLYPQYSGTTTASVMDSVYRTLGSFRNQPALRGVKHYHDHPGYIAALAQSIRDYWRQHGKPDKLVMSFHGVPRRTLDLGDPYHCECMKTGRLLAEALELNAQQYQITFQSRFGKAEWLKPYTAATVAELGRNGLRRVDVVCPGFVSDCLETLEEIQMEVKADFLNAGGKEFHYIPCLNDREDWIHALSDIAIEHLGSWASPQPDSKTAAEQSRLRAKAAGAAQ